MPGPCLNSWQERSTDWTTCIWHSSDYIQSGIFIGLALMLSYTVLVVIRFCRSYYLNRCEICKFGQDEFLNIRRANLNFIAEVYPAIAMLRGIASAAPFLGLAGTSYGFLAAFYHMGGSVSRASALGVVIDAFADVPAPTLAGILVAVPANFFYNVLRRRIEKLRSQVPSCGRATESASTLRFAQTLPLKARSSCFPPYALIAAPFLVCAVMAYMAFKVHPGPIGFPVQLLPLNPIRGDITSELVVVGLLSDGNGEPVILVNGKEVSPGNLREIAGEKLRRDVEPQAFVQADSAVLWSDVARVIDTIHDLHSRVILLTGPPQRERRRSQVHRPKFPIARPQPLR